MIGSAPLCNGCKHLHHGTIGWKCDAYPEGIPDEILWGDIDHHKPHKGDHGIQFDAVE